MMNTPLKLYCFLLGVGFLVIGILFALPSPNVLAQSDVIFLPAVIIHEAEASGQQVTPNPTLTPTQVATPVQSPVATFTPIILPTSTPTLTPDPNAILQYVGVTNQGNPVRLQVASDLSRVYSFSMEAQIICLNSAGSVSISLSDSLGYAVTNRTFLLTTQSSDGNENRFQGAFDNFGVTGSWSVWLDGPDVLQPCMNKGTWSASVQSSQN